MDNKFKHEVSLTILDKLILAGMIAVLTFGLNLVQDRVKARSDEKREIKKEQRAEIQRQLNDFYIPLTDLLQKDNNLWSGVIGPESVDSGPFREKLEKSIILDNHDAAVSIIQKHRNVVKDDILAKELDLYEEHVAIYKTLRNSGDTRTPEQYDHRFKFPTELYKLMSAKEQELQKEYTELSKAD